jgi:FixJ family two-component response regulator
MYIPICYTRGQVRIGDTARDDTRVVWGIGKMDTGVIAVVDGRQAVHEFVVQTLTAASYTVRGYRSRATFLVEAPTLQPSIILLGADDDAFDVDTPIVMATIRLAPYRPQLPVILYSANPDAKAREQIEDAPDVLPLPTPFTAERLLQAVGDVARGTATGAALT